MSKNVIVSLTPRNSPTGELYLRDWHDEISRNVVTILTPRNLPSIALHTMTRTLRLENVGRSGTAKLI
jgi:hypothetical protein